MLKQSNQIIGLGDRKKIKSDLEMVITRSNRWKKTKPNNLL